MWQSNLGNVTPTVEADNLAVSGWVYVTCPVVATGVAQGRPRHLVVKHLVVTNFRPNCRLGQGAHFVEKQKLMVILRQSVFNATLLYAS